MIEALKTRVRHFLISRQKDGTMPYWSLVAALAAGKGTKLSDEQLAEALEAAGKNPEDLEEDVDLLTRLAALDLQAGQLDAIRQEAAKTHAEANRLEGDATAMREKAQQLAQRSAELRNAALGRVMQCEQSSRDASDIRRKLRDRGHIAAGERIEADAERNAALAAVEPASVRLAAARRELEEQQRYVEGLPEAAGNSGPDGHVAREALKQMQQRAEQAEREHASAVERAQAFA